MPNIVYIATSLDGFIAREDGNLDWLMDVPNPDNSDFGFAEFLDRVDGVIMGRRTFDIVVGFGQWPYTKPVFVLSNTMTELPDGYTDKAEVVNGKIKDIIESLSNRGINNIYIDGGKTIQCFLKEDLIDEMIITRIPVLLGKGIPLFANFERDIKFKPVKNEVLNEHLVKTTYVRE